MRVESLLAGQAAQQPVPGGGEACSDSSRAWFRRLRGVHCGRCLSLSRQWPRAVSSVHASASVRPCTFFRLTAVS